MSALLDQISEKAFQEQVIGLARMNNWAVYHTFDSRRSQPGYPDLCLVNRAGRLIYAELKRQKGKPTPAQEEWLELLRRTPAEVYIWRPSDWPEIEEVLSK